VRFLSRKKLAIGGLFFLALSAYADAAETEPAIPQQSDTGIEGTISLGPVHPGPIRPGVPSSRPLADAEFTVMQDDRSVASFKTDEKGHFRVLLPPGHYTVVAQGKKRGIGHFGPFDVEVSAGQMAKVNWHCDTGMR
jgi:hypothetical protein